ncbi:hypothetical protein IE985_18310 [Klebsiella pneumoniae]|nr:hypothetical protein [Klebsiella pneumoniae]
MNRMSIVILWALALLVLQPALAAEPRQQPTAREQARTVTIFHQPVVMLQATFGQTTPEERVCAPVAPCAPSPKMIFASRCGSCRLSAMVSQADCC